MYNASKIIVPSSPGPSPLPYIYPFPSSHHISLPSHMPTGNLTEIGKCLDKYQKQKLVMAPGMLYKFPSHPTIQTPSGPNMFG